MASSVVKVEVELEVCTICGGSESLMTPEEYDASTDLMRDPLRTILLRLNSNKVVPDGKFCANCIRCAIEAHEFSNALAKRNPPPLSEKIRALRRKLHELTQKIDVFIVVGGSGGTEGVYNEEDIIMVEKDALAAATAADDEELEKARNARGDTVYQCTICPESFERVSDYREHTSTHSEDSLHSCWTCGAQFTSKDTLREHAEGHVELHTTTCYLCNTDFQSENEARLHAAQGTCAGGNACSVCGAHCGSRSALSAHAAQAHAVTPPFLCPACFRSYDSRDLFSAHVLRHRQDKRFVCAVDGCILRFADRKNLINHIRKCHSATLEKQEPEQPLSDDENSAYSCDYCQRTFASVAAMKRHVTRIHRDKLTKQENEDLEVSAQDTSMDGEVEYLEMEVLDDGELKYED